MNYNITFDGHMFVAYCEELNLTFASLTKESATIVIEGLIKFINESNILKLEDKDEQVI